MEQCHRAAMMILALVVLAATLPSDLHAQAFFASRPDANIAIERAWIRATVTPKEGMIDVDVILLPRRPSGRQRGTSAREDIYLLWPGAVIETAEGPPEPTLAKMVDGLGLDIIRGGRLGVTSSNMYEATRRQVTETTASFVTFTRLPVLDRTTAALATYIRIPTATNPDWITRIRMRSKGVVQRRTATWLEESISGRHYTAVLTFSEVRSRVVFPVYVRFRRQLLKLDGDGTLQLVLNFQDADRLRVESISPPSARRLRSETLEDIDTVSLEFDASEQGLPQTLTVQFAYFDIFRAIGTSIGFFILAQAAGMAFAAFCKQLLRLLKASKALLPRQGEDFS